MDRRVAAIRIVEVLVIGIVIIFVFFIGRRIEEHYFGSNTDIVDESNLDRINYNGQWYEKNKEVDVILFIGIDKFDTKSEKDQSEQSDFLLALVINNKAMTYQGIMINRDTMTEIKEIGSLGDTTGTKIAQIALAHAYGTNDRERAQNTRWAVENLLYHVSIKNYVAFTMDAVPIFNDLVGGVTVNVRDDFSGVDDTLKTGKAMTLKGEQALTFVRARKGMKEATNINRMSRQNEYLDEFMDCARKCADDNSEFYIKALDKVGDYLEMNCSSNDIIQLNDVLRNYKYEGIQKIEGTISKEKEFMELYVDEEKLQQLIVDVFYVKE